MTKKDILTKIKKSILDETESTPGVSVTKKVQKSEKGFNDEYYKDSNKKFKDYTKLKEPEIKAPKRNAEPEEEKTYGGSGMEGLTYDNEGTEYETAFKNRVDDLNKPSKDYYLKKDEVNDVYGKLKKKGDDYRKEKKKFHNTPPVRAIEAESTIKRLNYKTKFINESTAFNLIPEDFKKDNLIFEMSDGNKTYRLRWEGNQKVGTPIIISFKDAEKINEELDKMFKLADYKSKDTFGKSDLLTEETQMKEFFLKKKTLAEQVSTTTTTTTQSNAPGAIASSLPKGECYMVKGNQNKNIYVTKSGNDYTFNLYDNKIKRLYEPPFLKYKYNAAGSPDNWIFDDTKVIRFLDVYKDKTFLLSAISFLITDSNDKLSVIKSLKLFLQRNTIKGLTNISDVEKFTKDSDITNFVSGNESVSYANQFFNSHLMKC